MKVRAAGQVEGIACLHSIYYRRLSMDTTVEPLGRAEAEEYASWFKALADGTRIQIVSLLARRREPMTVGEIVTVVEISQSTVSHHLKILAEVRFVLVERQGTSSLYRINEACVSCFPTAADVVMGNPVPAMPACE
jgi:DNA-binding transcriptional ArsR family regulator